MSFAVSPEAYQRFMGRYSVPLASAFADFAGVAAVAGLGEGVRVLDVGCGPGALTAVLTARLGVPAVSAVDPSEAFVAAVGERFPGIDVHRAKAETLPFEDRTFAAALAQLVVHFMRDPVAGLREMGRVTRPGGVVAACVWDHEGGGGPLALFWDAVRSIDPDARDEADLAGARRGHLGELFAAAGLTDVEETALTVSVEHPTFEEWWEPFTLGVGPAGQHVSGLDEAGRGRLRERCRALLPAAPFTIDASAWAARGQA